MTRCLWNKMKQAKGYNLVEVLLVMSIIAVLASFLLQGAIKARQKGKLTKAHVQMDSIAAALRMYQDSFGTVPPDDTIYRYSSNIAASGPECLYYYLGAAFKAGVNASIYAGPFMSYRGDEVQTTSATSCDLDGDGSIDDDLKRILDPWGRPYHYNIPATHNINTYDLYSEGPNMTDNGGAGDDVNNWE